MTTCSFIGEATHNLDDKGRLALPGKFREELRKSQQPDELVAYMSSQDGCLYLYPAEQWQKIESAIDVQENPKVRKALFREYGLNSERLTLDKTGRLSLSAGHRESAALEREVKVIGSINKIEIWSTARLAACRQAEEEIVASILEDVALPV